jgi:hypothetical protein
MMKEKENRNVHVKTVVLLTGERVEDRSLVVMLELHPDNTSRP